MWWQWREKLIGEEASVHATTDTLSRRTVLFGAARQCRCVARRLDKTLHNACLIIFSNSSLYSRFSVSLVPNHFERCCRRRRQKWSPPSTSRVVFCRLPRRRLPTTTPTTKAIARLVSDTRLGLFLIFKSLKLSVYSISTLSRDAHAIPNSMQSIYVVVVRRCMQQRRL